MKKLLLITLLLCGFIQAWAYKWTDENGVTWTYTLSASNATITQSSQTSGDLVIPSKVGTGIQNVNYIVTKIGESAFRDCSSLTSVTIPEGVTIIDNHAFRDCSGLTSVNIPSNVTKIGESAFFGCSGLTSVTIPSSVTSIGSSAFKGCTGLTGVTIGEGVTSIGNSAFSGCSGLTSIIIPSNVTKIGASAFLECSGLTSVKVETGNKVYDSRNNCNAIIETSSNTLIVGCRNTIIPNDVSSIGSSAFSYCTGLTSVTIPEGVTSIGSSAFYYCTDLSSMTIPKGVTKIGDDAFNNCSSLTEVYCYIKAPLTISSNTFSNRFNATLYVPSGSKSAYQKANYWKDFKNIADLDTPTDIHDASYDGTEGKTIKVFKNGRVKILKDGKVYDLNGTREK